MNSKLRTPNSELKTIFQRKSSIDEIFSQLTLDAIPSSPKKILFRGEGTGELSSYAAGWMAAQGGDVIVLDGANRFDPYMVSFFAKRALIPPERLLKRIRIARAFTCYQMATLMREKLSELIEQEGAGLPDLFPSPFRRGSVRVRVDREDLAPLHRRPWVILLGPITTFFDEDVPEREIQPLCEKSLKKVEDMAMKGIPFFLFQAPVSSNSKRAYLTRRLFQFSNEVWRISVEDGGPKIVLEKKIADGR